MIGTLFLVLLPVRLMLMPLGTFGFWAYIVYSVPVLLCYFYAIMRVPLRLLSLTPGSVRNDYKQGVSFMKRTIYKCSMIATRHKDLGISALLLRVLSQPLRTEFYFALPLTTVPLVGLLLKLEEQSYGLPRDTTLYLIKFITFLLEIHLPSSQVWVLADYGLCNSDVLGTVVYNRTWLISNSGCSGYARCKILSWISRSERAIDLGQNLVLCIQYLGALGHSQGLQPAFSSLNKGKNQ